MWQDDWLVCEKTFFTVLNLTFHSLVAKKYPTVTIGKRRQVCGPFSNNGQSWPSKICQYCSLHEKKGKLLSFLFIVQRRLLLICVFGHKDRVIYGMPCSKEKYEFKNIILLISTKWEYLAIRRSMLEQRNFPFERTCEWLMNSHRLFLRWCLEEPSGWIACSRLWIGDHSMHADSIYLIIAD